MISSIQSQKGYATVLAVVLFAILGLSLVGLYSSTQLTFHKQKEQNAADAAAYSIATLTARDLNLISYTNRAMVANQVAIGQMVGLVSWVEMLDNAAMVLDWIATTISWVPVIGQIIKTITEVLKEVTNILKEVINAIAEVAIPILDMINAVYSEAQHVFHIGMLAAAPGIYKEVVETNDPDVKKGVVTNAYSAVTYVKNLNKFIERNKTPKVNGSSTKDKRHLKRYEEFDQVVEDSFDDFTRKRDNNWFEFDIGIFRGGIYKEGGTQFDRGESSGDYVWEWNSMDTLHISIEERKWDGWDSIIDLPLGWGASHALHDSRSSDNYNYAQHSGDSNNKKRWGSGAWELELSAWLATIEYATNNIANVKGLREFYDIKEDSDKLKKEGKESRGPAMMVLLEKPIGEVKNSRGWKKLLQGSGGSPGKRTDIEEQAQQKNNMYALAKAEPYYMRPNDDGASHFWRENRDEWEYGNLYNPYWQPRLVETTSAERWAALALAGIN